MTTLNQKKNINLLILKYLLLTIISGIVIVEIISIVRMKPFWLDEWFVIVNIKFKEIEEFFFRPLDFNQGFPRAYLVLIKYFSRIFNYNYLSLVLIPFIVQLLNIVFFWYVSTEIIYKEDKLKSYLLILVFLSYETTFIYFTQVKQYTMEMFCSLLALWQFYEFSKCFKDINVTCFRFWIAVGIFLVAPFFSYSYPIIATPLIISLFITFLFTPKKFSNITKTLFPLILFLIAIVTEYHLDIKYAISLNIHLDDWWRSYIATYESFNLFALNLLRSFFIFMSLIFIPIDKTYKDTIWSSDHMKYIVYLVRILFFLIPTVIGMINISIYTIKSFIDRTKKENSFFKGFKIISFNESFSISIFFFILFFAVWVLYFLSLLPLGPKRVNYFCVPMVGYLWLEGVSFFKRNKKKLFYAYGNIILIIGLIFLLIFIGVGYTKEALEKSGSQALWYQTIGKAIKAAYETDAVIVRPEEQKWEHAQGWHFDLMLRTHPYYNHKKDLKIVSMDDIKNKCKHIKKEELSFIIIEENDFNIVSLKDLCLSLSE
ncbi:MAG: hypothetical protein HZB30_09780 [Nitrospirae bacterium]|nr:hypothetical protein [Nitrospirota bacterium]